MEGFQIQVMLIIWKLLKLYFKDKVIEFSKGDAILIEVKDKYYYETDYAVLALLCTPAWSPSQHKIEE